MDQGRVIWLTGLSGAGKTTLLRSIGGDVTGLHIDSPRGFALAFARAVADKVIFMDGGVIVEQGAPEAVFGDTQQERTKQFLARYNERP